MSKSKQVARKGADATSGGLPAVLAEELAKEAANYSANVKVTGESNMISTRNGRFSFRGEELGSEINVVILNLAHVNEYYPGKFNPQVKVTPACYALSRSGEDMVPHTEAPDKQSADCTSCPMSAIGSDTERGGRACKQKMRVSVIAEEDVTNAEAAAEALVCRVMVPAMSKNKLASYIKVIADNPKFRAPPYAVVTKLKLIPHERFQYVMEFEPVQIVGKADVIGVLRSRANGEGLDSVMAAYPQLSEGAAKGTGRGNSTGRSAPARSAPPPPPPAKSSGRRSRFS